MKSLRMMNQLLTMAQKLEQWSRFLAESTYRGSIPEWMKHEAEKCKAIANLPEE